MGHYLNLCAYDKCIGIVMKEESSADIKNIKKLLKILKISYVKGLNDYDGYALKKEWIALIQSYFKDTIDLNQFDYEISFGYSDKKVEYGIEQTEMSDEDYQEWKRIRGMSVKTKFLYADKVRRRFRYSDLVMVIERQEKNRPYNTQEWETVDLKKDFTILKELNAKFDVYSPYPHISLTRKHKKIISHYVTKKLVSCQKYQYVAYFYFSRRANYRFV